MIKPIVYLPSCIPKIMKIRAHL